MSSNTKFEAPKRRTTAGHLLRRVGTAISESDRVQSTKRALRQVSDAVIPSRRRAVLQHRAREPERRAQNITDFLSGPEAHVRHPHDLEESEPVSRSRSESTESLPRYESWAPPSYESMQSTMSNLHLTTSDARQLVRGGEAPEAVRIPARRAAVGSSRSSPPATLSGSSTRSAAPAHGSSSASSSVPVPARRAVGEAFRGKVSRFREDESQL